MARTTAATLVVALVIGGFAAARAQTPPAQGSSPQDIMPALLTEVRGLRAAMEQMASSGARVQLTLGRLQLQEQRLNTAIKRLDDTRTRLAEMQRNAMEQQEQLSSMETMLKGEFAVAVAGQPKEGMPDRETVEEMLKNHRSGVARVTSEIQRLTAEEAMLANEVATEQSRWTDINQRLEELERSLGCR